MSTQQPEWEFLANLGDANPIDHGGYFIYKDKTGVYPEEAELLEVDDEDGKTKWTVYRIILERCTVSNGVLSDNKFHPEHPAWFADYIDGIASAIGQTPQTVRDWLCSEDPLKRAEGYRAIGDIQGWINLDQYPLDFTRRREVESRYKEKNK